MGTSISSLARIAAISPSFTKSTASNSPKARRYSGMILLVVILAPLSVVCRSSPLLGSRFHFRCSAGHQSVTHQSADFLLAPPYGGRREQRLAAEFLAELARGEVVHRDSHQAQQGGRNAGESKHAGLHAYAQQSGNGPEEILE